MKKICDVTIIAANYNNSEFLPAFFESIISSTVSPRSVIFVDDGSKDNSLNIANRYKEKIPQLQIIALPQNEGFGNALNVGIEASTTKYIMRIDPDDIIHEERIEKQYDVLEHNLLDVVGSNAIIFHSVTGIKLGTTKFPLDHSSIGKRIIAGEHGVLHATVMGRTELFRKHKYIQENVPAEDYDIFARLYKSGATFGNLPDCLISYRVHGKSASNILPFNTIEKTYKLRDAIFSTKTTRIKILAYYMHIKNYRRYLFSTNPSERFLFGMIASLLYPSKIIRRIIDKVVNH